MGKSLLLPMIIPTMCSFWCEIKAYFDSVGQASRCLMLRTFTALRYGLWM
jgi:hypothetical protein